ncbi:MAG: alpha/beta hydrolase, partial [Gammaproteobacteria bacterium]|nr:alpha/beta hydrolase [Gammaproteobacteria bacterium]
MNRRLRGNIAIVIAALLAAACRPGDPGARSVEGECVVLLHGLARTSLSMEIMAWSLEEAGFTVANIDYPSRDHPIEAL